jgi:hypothetical protein
VLGNGDCAYSKSKNKRLLKSSNLEVDLKTNITFFHSFVFLFILSFIHSVIFKFKASCIFIFLENTLVMGDLLYRTNINGSLRTVKCNCVKCSVNYHEAYIKGITDVNLIQCKRCQLKMSNCLCCVRQSVSKTKQKTNIADQLNSIKTTMVVDLRSFLIRVTNTNRTLFFFSFSWESVNRAWKCSNYF